MPSTTARLAPALLAVALVGCAPNSAEITAGEYIAFLASTNSLSLQKGTVVPEDYQDTYNIDCREFETKEDENALRLEDPLDICGPQQWPPDYEQWATQSGFRVVAEPLEPWRGQALVSWEGDLQVQFHQHVPGGGDFRFVFAIDPDFQPVDCEGEEHVLKDGYWIDNWSTELERIAALPDDKRAHYPYLEGLEDGRMWFLNAFSYQYSPGEDPSGEVSTTWSIPDYWVAGAAQGKFADELVFHRTSRYGEPSLYNFVEDASGTYGTGQGTDLFYCYDQEAGVPTKDQLCSGASASLTDQEQRVDDIRDGIMKEMDLLATPDGADEPLYSYGPVSHGNMWRLPDGNSPGLDAWAELQYNYVVFDKSSDLTVGGQASGAFSLVLDASDSSTRVFVQGRFEIPKIKRDKWQSQDLAQSKRVESGIQFCKAASYVEANLDKEPTKVSSDFIERE